MHQSRHRQCSAVCARASVRGHSSSLTSLCSALKWHYTADHEQLGLSETKSNACEIAAWRFLSRLSEREVMNFCLYEIPDVSEALDELREEYYDQEAAERTPLLPRILRSSNDGSRAVPVGSSSKRATLLTALSPPHQCQR